MLRFFIINLLLLTSNLHGREVDNCSQRDREISNSTAVINNVINRHLRSSIKALNKNLRGSIFNNDFTKCEPGRPLSEVELDIVRYELDQNWPPVYYSLRHEKTIASIERDRKDSIYVNATSGLLPNFVNTLDPVVNVGESRVGLDKLDHFFGHGYVYYQKWKETNSLEAALKIGVDREHGGWGLSGTGVESYGDRSANYAAFLFWKRLAEVGTDSFIKCENGTFAVRKPIDISKYVDDSWDESINCSNFAPTDLSGILSKMRENCGTECPVEMDTCARLREKYPANIRKYILHPRCLHQDYKYSLKGGSPKGALDTVTEDFTKGLEGFKITK